ncbi:beta_helix domain-containing protein [Nephila pilipes]|uniref:Beta_helix domain-containing protein n=1 Tax=Nephila pilipes TaxID=299642 RepID=A0A8X6MZT7_NEPPI|nr:beta_helix domain-containing protein [Nephila pilipes]
MPGINVQLFRAKMSLLIVYIILVFGFARAFDYDYGNFELCKTYEDLTTKEPSLECFCENRENFTMHPIYDFDITRITVRGCGNVRVPFAALNNLQLEVLEFLDLERLTILSFSLSSVQGVEILKIADIADLEVVQHAFVGLYNIDRFILRNVTANILTRDAFSSITNVRHFMVEDSTFKNVEELAFAIHNVTNFSAKNTEFHTLENCAFLIHNSEEVLFDNCVFQETKNGSFILSFVDSLVFRNSQFGELATSYLQSNGLKTFSIINSVIEELKPEAFKDLEVHELINFKNNTIKIAYENSLNAILTQPSNYIDIKFCCNSFTCDCNIFWLWSLKDIDENVTVLEKNWCIGDKQKSLNNYIPIMDSNNNCMTLESRPFKTTHQFLNETQLAKMIEELLILFKHGFELILNKADIRQMV